MKLRDLDIPWSELKLVLAIQREGSLRGAAKALRISHPTVSRRVAELQDGLGVHLFEREGRRLRLTVAGEDLAATAARIEMEVDGLGRRIAGRDHRLEGVVRVALAPSMFAALAPALPDFSEVHPGIELELITSLGFASLTRREADIAIRHTDSPDEILVGRKLSVFEQAVYVTRSLEARLRATGNGDPLTWPWIDWDESHRHHSSARWVSENIEADKVVVRCDNSLTMYQLARAGMGVGYVPTMLAAPDPELVHVEPQEAFPVFHRGIWVLTHADLRNMGRIRATMQWLGELLRVKDGGVWLGYA
jgi:DNA-binding transcriptional LysR family regulator